MTDRQATCSCGKLVVRTRGEPVRVSICHCLACQKRTGSVFGAQARFPSDAVTIEGQSREYAQAGDSGSIARFRFCGDCGATVCWQADALPGFVTVAVGAFADPGFPPPQVSVYEQRRHSWLGLPDDMEHFD
jgi:hypothetical protein